ncbi:helical backbone metal receptor [soil metagenome]
MTVFKDQLGREVFLSEIPKRIISLVPSQTELLFDLGLDETVIGITRFCIHPEQWFETKTRVGGTKDFKLEMIRMLKPDLIIANKEENNLEGLLPLMNEFPVWISDVSNLDDALRMISSIGAMTGTNDSANDIISKIKTEYQRLAEYLVLSPPINNRCVYYIWYKPWMSIGEDTFIYNQLVNCGFSSVTERRQRYPEISIEEAKNAEAELVFLSSEPFPFQEKHSVEVKAIFPEAIIKFVDGEFFSWYGSRLVTAPSYFISLLESLKTRS